MSDIKPFDERGCVYVPKFLDARTTGVVSQYLENRIKRGEWTEGVDTQGCSRYFYYADPLIEVLLCTSKDLVEAVTGRELIPTYSYTRVYQSGESLSPHVDRPSCEVSVTVNVATKGNFSPIFMQYGQNDPEKYILHPGDAVVYKGCEAMHWRQPLLEDQLNVQFMLHYVDKHGPNAGWALDKRGSYGTALAERKQ